MEKSYESIVYTLKLFNFTASPLLITYATSLICNICWFECKQVEYCRQVDDFVDRLNIEDRNL